MYTTLILALDKAMHINVLCKAKQMDPGSLVAAILLGASMLCDRKWKTLYALLGCCYYWVIAMHMFNLNHVTFLSIF